MNFPRTIAAYAASVAATYLLSAVFYTNRVLAGQASFGATYTPAQQAETYLTNIAGLWLYGAMIAIALLAAFAVAWGVKRVLKPLAPVAYPVAGGAAIYVLLALVEAQLGGGAGVIGGARTGLGVALQCLAGFVGGVVFASVRPRR
jgi:hypothetical protein